MARMAQERLMELERTDASIIDQVQQASLFAGIAISEIRTLYPSENPQRVFKDESCGKPHGRQEYVLRWLLKKFQDGETRRYTVAWRLLERLTNFVPLKNTARVLNERKFVLVLRQALEEAVATVSLADDSSNKATGSSVKGLIGSPASKKRTRNGKLLNDGKVSHSAVEDDKDIVRWKWTVYSAVNCIVQLSKPGLYSNGTSGSEYMKSAIRTSGDEAARILGAWLALHGNEKQPSTVSQGDSLLLLPFLNIWDLRLLGPEDAQVFSRHCLNQSLRIISTAGQRHEHVAQLEKLLAHSIIVPSKLAYGFSKDANYLAGLVGNSVSRSSEFAPVIFDVTIRCIHPRGSRPRTTDGTAWLQAVICALKETLSVNPSEESVVALNQMLRYCINHKIILELPFLRLIVSQYGLPSEITNWDLLATIIELDSNTFLIPSKPEDFLKDVLERITKASIEASWPTVVDKVIEKVLVPLMGEFSKARQLTTFIYHWYEQLANFDKTQQSLRKDIEHFSAWEDEALRVKLKELMEPSLATHQIIELIDWLVEKVKECEGPACVLLDAVAGAVSNEDIRTALHSTLMEKAVNVFVYTGRDDRYKARLLHLNTIMVDWSSWKKFEDNSVEDGSSPLFLNLLSSEISFPDRDHSIVALEAFRYLCAQWSIGSPRFWDDPPIAFRNGTAVETLSNHITSVAAHIRKVIGQMAELRRLVEERWEGRVITIKRDLGWLACEYASCILVEYPQVLELCTEGQMLTDIIWIASTTTPSPSLHIEDPWLPLRHSGLPSMWMKMLKYDGYVENSKKISQNVINRMLQCGTHVENPIERSKACNGFVVMCFHHLPIELLSKINREAILKAWPPEPFDPSLIDVASVLYKMAPLDPAILSLKAKMFQLPTLYKGIKFKELEDIAECIVLSGREQKVQLETFAEIPELILDHVFATIDQPKSRDYIQGAKEALENWLQFNQRTKKALSYAMIRLFQVVIMAWRTKGIFSDEFSMALKKTTEKLSASFKNLLLKNIQRRLQNLEKLSQDDGERCMSLYSTMDALDAIDTEENDLASLQLDTMSILNSLKELNSELGKRFELFLTEHFPRVFGEPLSKLLKGDMATITGREAIRRKALAITKQMTEPEKVRMVNDLLKEMRDEKGVEHDLENDLDKSLALKHIIGSCEGARTVAQQADDNDNKLAGLSSTYSTLVNQLQGSDSFRRCWLVCETMEMILHDKPQVITQYIIDNTLASITILCSPGAPNLNPSGASTIYLHLVNLFHTVLTSHRRKLQGRFHLVVQSLQALLHCLFTPSPIGTHNHTKTSLPPWLNSSPHTRTLGAAHAGAYTRLLTAICDPPVSAVSRPSSSSLTSATKKAKAYASLHMPYVLSTYVQAQLNMSLAMKQEVREALVPGWYAIFDTMSVEGRRVLGESMDASGRAVLAELVRDWVRFGKWNGGYTVAPEGYPSS